MGHKVIQGYKDRLAIQVCKALKVTQVHRVLSDQQDQQVYKDHEVIRVYRVYKAQQVIQVHRVFKDPLVTLVFKDL